MSFTIWFTGLPSSGKSTVAKRVENELTSMGMKIHNLDGDDLRAKLHPDLGFTREERGINNKRIAFICDLLNRNDVSSIVAAISPFEEYRKYAEEMIDNFFLVYVECSVEECKERDPKNLYEKAEEGKIKNFTGVNHPYEEPENPDVKVNTKELSVEKSKEKVLNGLRERGFLDQKIDEYIGMTNIEEEETKERLRNLGYLDQ
ncbi:MAG: adenylyl-sulfate kinase [Candidatus Aenigmatarchaeota archaeon]